MKAIVDVDGVLADFEGALVDHLANKFGKGMYELNRSVYSLEERYKNLPDVWTETVRFLNRPSSYGSLAEIYTGVNFVNDLVRQGWDVLFLSSRPQVARNATERWLNWRVEDYYNTRGVLVGVEDKIVVAKEWGADLLVDDNPVTIESGIRHGVVAIAWDQPWNEGVFPRLVYDRDNVVYVWKDESTEEQKFFEVFDLVEAE